MKWLFLIPAFLVCGHVFAQDSALFKKLLNVRLAPNQYFSFSAASNVVALSCIVPDPALKNPDSLRSKSADLYHKIEAVTGPKLELDICYVGKLSDKNFVAFSYARSGYRGEVTYTKPDSLLPPYPDVLHRLVNFLPDNIYVRHRNTPLGLCIQFYVISQVSRFDSAKSAQLMAVHFLTRFIGGQYCQYYRMEIYLINPFSEKGNRYMATISDLILNTLSDY